MGLAGLMAFMRVMGMASSVACLPPRAVPLTWIRNHLVHAADITRSAC